MISGSVQWTLQVFISCNISISLTDIKILEIFEDKKKSAIMQSGLLLFISCGVYCSYTHKHTYMQIDKDNISSFEASDTCRKVQTDGDKEEEAQLWEDDNTKLVQWWQRRGEKMSSVHGGYHCRTNSNCDLAHSSSSHSTFGICKRYSESQVCFWIIWCYGAITIISNQTGYLYTALQQ